jgi:predicted RNase H-like nuclease (RuvC/YqgF family)
MAKIHGKEEKEGFTSITVDNITEEQIVAMAKYIQLLQEENQNLKGYITQLQAQLQAARQNRATAEYRLQQQQGNEIVVTSTIEDEYKKG